MAKINKHIEIVRASRSGLSSMSQLSCDAILAVLERHYVAVGVTIINRAADLDILAAQQPDVVFLGMKFVPASETSSLGDSAKIWLTDYLDSQSISYTGSSGKAHELERDKALAKQCVLAAGLATSPYRVVRRGQLEALRETSLNFPLFVKPTNRGGGVGVDAASVVRNIEELNIKISSISARLQADSLVEQYLPGREFSVAILRDELSAELALMPLELIAPMGKRGARLLSSRVKSSNSELAIEVTDQSVKAMVTTLALQVFQALGARDYGRIDIRLDGAGWPHFLEANLLPSLISGYGSFPKACQLNLQLDHEQMILAITSLALTRSASQHYDGDDQPEMVVRPAALARLSQPV
ncbi:MAG: D-alanine--D-alanine ligase family protein [Candidatus Saccharimonadales bacterium]